MKTKVFSIYDSKVKAFMSPFFMQHQGQAIRAFQGLIADKNTNVGKYPADFTLMEIGTFDEESGRLESLEGKVDLGNALKYSENTN